MKAIKIEGKAKERLSQLIINKQMTETAINEYFSGLIAGKGLEGDWNLDLGKWEIAPVKPPEAEGKADALH